MLRSVEIPRAVRAGRLAHPAHPRSVDLEEHLPIRELLEQNGPVRMEFAAAVALLSTKFGEPDDACEVGEVSSDTRTFWNFDYYCLVLVDLGDGTRELKTR